ncbi:HypC/HybG/HupF family hydrogenase formation chaperone [Chrysiogenes arsenatis]|uniref:HypC/HybG/HupF family hydrogenase formation chaperone n=1 Tax=Chrysiogenes arsenatis TaxID=309797 RepID=UPI000427DECA|nr:HypC/HybG/HupF family hydrogenase formation chaperone [Chrysiogenes arsenatis]
MCLSIPSRVESIDEHNIATVDTMGVQRKVSLDLMGEPVAVGDYILLHVGFAIGKIDTDAAEQSLATYQEMIRLAEAAEER